jgi:hypothetical protein
MKILLKFIFGICPEIDFLNAAKLCRDAFFWKWKLKNITSLE